MAGHFLSGHITKAWTAVAICKSLTLKATVRTLTPLGGFQNRPDSHATFIDNFTLCSRVDFPQIDLLSPASESGRAIFAQRAKKSRDMSEVAGQHQQAWEKLLQKTFRTATARCYAMTFYIFCKVAAHLATFGGKYFYSEMLCNLLSSYFVNEHFGG